MFVKKCVVCGYMPFMFADIKECKRCGGILERILEETDANNNR